MALRQPADHGPPFAPVKPAANRRNKSSQRFQQRRFTAAIKPDNRRQVSCRNHAAHRRSDCHAFIPGNQMIQLNHGSATAHHVASHSAASSPQAIATRAAPDAIKTDVNISPPQ